MNYYVSYNEKNLTQSIYYLDDTGKLSKEYNGLIGELLTDFLYLDFKHYKTAYNIILERYKNKIYENNKSVLHSDLQWLELIITSPEIFSSEDEIAEIFELCINASENNKTKYDVLHNTNLVKSSKTSKITINTHSPMHPYFKSIDSESYRGLMDNPLNLFYKVNYPELQQFYIQAIRYIFNIGLENDLSDLTKVQRLYLFSIIKDYSLILPNKYGYPGSTYSMQDLFSVSTDISEKIRNIPEVDAIKLLKSNEIILNKLLILESPYMACYIELMKLVELDLCVKVCKNCGKLFAYSEGYNVEYCNRIADGENRTCKEIGASRTYTEKVKNSPVLESYSRAYKTHYARIRYKKITKYEFESWSREAANMREKALNNEISLDEFKNWLKR